MQSRRRTSSVTKSPNEFRDIAHRDSLWFWYSVLTTYVKASDGTFAETQQTEPQGGRLQHFGRVEGLTEVGGGAGEGSLKQHCMKLWRLQWSLCCVGRPGQSPGLRNPSSQGGLSGGHVAQTCGKSPFCYPLVFGHEGEAFGRSAVWGALNVASGSPHWLGAVLQLSVS